MAIMEDHRENPRVVGIIELQDDQKRVKLV
jgi:hypothetical protein